MTLPSGAHFQIGPYEFNADEAVGSDQSLIRPHYLHSTPTNLSPRTNISGAPGKENLQPDFPLWALSDWSGGQELKILTDPTTQGTRYDNGLCNSRYPGQLSGVPTRTDSNLSPTGNFRPILVNAIGYVWLCQGLQTWYSSDGVTWTLQDNGHAAGPTQITHAVGGSDGLYIVLETTPGQTSQGQWKKVFVGGNANAVALGTYGTVYGLAFLNGLIYSWATNNTAPVSPTRALKSYDTTSTFPMTGSSPLYTTGLANTSGNSYFDACTSENSVILMESDDSQTRIHEYKAGAGSLIWNMPQGFSGRAVTVSLGVVFVAGVYIGGFAALFGMSLQDRIPQFIRYIGQTTGTAYTPSSMAAGPGDQVLVAMTSGEIFIYSEGLDGLSQLDTRSGFTSLGSVATYKAKRMAAWRDDGGAKVQISSWADDSATTTSGATVVSPAWDMGYPEEDKTLLGVHAVFTPITGAQTISVSYQVNEDGIYHALPTINSVTPGAAVGNVYLPISDDTVSGGGMTGTVSYRLIRLKIVLNNGAVLYSLTTRAYMPNYTETWEIVVKVKDETTLDRVKTRMVRASRLVDYLIGDGSASTDPPGTLGVVPGKKVVVFKDGYPYKKQGQFRSALVTVELVGHIIHERAAGGNMRLALKSVVP